MSMLLAGLARDIITPPLEIDLCGYAGRIPGNIGAHDDLHAKAMVISDRETKIAIVTLDLVGLTAEQVAGIRQLASAQTGIPRAHIMIASSHTHGGPAPTSIRACGNADETYVQGLLNRIVDLIRRAASDLVPVKFGFGSATASIAINRRKPDSGVIDKEIGIWRFTTEDSGPFATIFNYACHAVVLGSDNRLVTADWPGAAQREIESEIDGQAMFLQGCCGDINPAERGDYDMAERAGNEVAREVISSLSGIPFSENSKIEVRSQTAQLPLQPPEFDEAERTAAEMEDFFASVDEEIHLWQIHINRAYLDWARAVVSLGKEGNRSVPFEIQRISIGDARIIALPGEIFVEYALNLKRMRRNTMVAGYANGLVGYVPTRAALGDGGYEVDLAYRLYGEQRLAPEVEDIILASGRDLLSD